MTMTVEPVTIDAPSLRLMTGPEALACVAQIREGLENVRLLLLDLHEREGWRALGYESWRECAAAEFSLTQSRAYQLLDAANGMPLMGPNCYGFVNTLSRAALWNEVKDKLQQSGSGLSGGQQQRLCIARGIAIKPEVLLLDEPCSALDPISTGKIEELIGELKHDYTVVIVTHNMQQAARCSDYTAYMYLGDLVEFGPTREVFTKPKKKDTEDYITGRFG